MIEHVVKQECELLRYLIDDLHFSRNVAKKILNNSTYVNNKKISKYNYLLKKGDVVKIASDTSNKYDLDIIYEDDDFVVINKPSGLLSISSDNESYNTAYHYVREYLKDKDKHNKVFVLHRIDKDTSGVLVFCKNVKLRDALQNDWNNLVKTRKYYAIVDGKLDKKEDCITNYLTKNKFDLVYVSNFNDRNAKKAITEYSVIKENNKYSLLDLNIYTGRKNQIRVTMKDLGHPILGDKNYGGEKYKRLCLHAYELSFLNPLNNKTYSFKTKMPSLFNTLIK